MKITGTYKLKIPCEHWICKYGRKCAVGCECDRERCRTCSSCFKSDDCEILADAMHITQDCLLQMGIDLSWWRRFVK